MQDRGTLVVSAQNVYADRPIGHFTRIDAGEYVCLSVSDTGPGIPQEIQAKIFEPFFTTKVKARRQGCGLGLSIVQAIVADHEGQVDVISEMGKGTTFRVYLPPSREQAREEQQGAFQGGNESILVVDDDHLQREVARQLLTALGYKVETVPSGEEAISFLRQRRVDLLILDMIMPTGMDGAECFRRVQEIRPDQKAIIVSGFSESELVRQAQVLGAGSYLRKPVTREKLAEAVRNELDKPVPVKWPARIVAE